MESQTTDNHILQMKNSVAWNKRSNQKANHDQAMSSDFGLQTMMNPMADVLFEIRPINPYFYKITMYFIN